MGPGALSIGEDVAAARPGGPPGPDRTSLSVRGGQALRAVLADRKLAVPLGVLALMVLFAIFMPIFWSHGPDKQDLINSLGSPSASHPLGTDQLGRDVLARRATRARLSLPGAQRLAPPA